MKKDERKRTREKRRKLERATISMPADLLGVGQARAALLDRPFSSYVATLIRRDTEEAPALV